MQHDVDVLIIGAGQAGLAAGYYLHRANRDLAPARQVSFALVDARDEPGGAWQEAWDSLRLFSPSDTSSLPGRQLAPEPGVTYRLASVLPEYFRDYEARYELPVTHGVRIRSVFRDGKRWLALGEDGQQWTARILINATGVWDAPVIPQIPGADTFSGELLHTVDYRRASDFTGKRVVVVGGGNSGAQIAADLLETAASLDWTTRRPPRLMPDHIDGADLFRLTSLRVAGKPISPDDVPVGDIIAVESVRRARDKHGLTAREMFTHFDDRGVIWPDGSRSDVDTVIMCTGFAPALAHLAPLGLAHPPAVDDIEPSQSREHPGLYFLGYGDWCGPASATIIGAGRAAKGCIASVLDYLAEARR